LNLRAHDGHIDEQENLQQILFESAEHMTAILMSRRICSSFCLNQLSEFLNSSAASGHEMLHGVSGVVEFLNKNLYQNGF
jgi:hypothetical protein